MNLITVLKKIPTEIKIKEIIKDLKFKKNDNSKIYLGISLELLWAVWGQFSFR